ncbi:hypothetical protein Q5H93_00810 [Hymenobacter sp. ASUV-10]|uniref:Lipocalin-like domain-containing protein n=1 Tax=Hymenobacter aranciens TaxID=3063996 RepID=A0ABT9B4R4_9BACT|nr:hypothetical protein [Hymenobacter sp. ASUV-10]MDO7873254.1 hypothetical protein [Hymenobacter sp. ASUV-10]
MTKISTCLVALSLGLLLASCGGSGNSNPTPSVSPRTQLLTTPKWRISGISQALTFNGQTITTNAYAGVSSCRKDDFGKFNVDKTVVTDEGATKCSSSAPQSKTGTWSFNTAETEITVVDPNPTPGSIGNATAEILQMTATNMQLRTTTTQTQAGYPITVVLTTDYIAL